MKQVLWFVVDDISLGANIHMTGLSSQVNIVNLEVICIFDKPFMYTCIYATGICMLPNNTS